MDRQLTIETAEDVYALRQAGRAAAAAVGVHTSGQIRVATALSELGREIVATGASAVAQFALAPNGWLEVRIVGYPISALQPHENSAIESAKRLIEALEVVQGASGSTVSLRLPAATARASAELQRAVAEATAPRPLDELRMENRDLIATLNEVREQQEQLVQLNAELEDTNRGVMAMYGQLSDELEETNRGVVALYAELDDKTLQLRAANEAKTRFLASVSHELRSPVISIVGLIKILLDPTEAEALSEDQRTQLGYVQSSSNELLHLVNALLDLAKAESGRIVPEIGTFELATLFSELRGSVRPLVPEGVKLIVSKQAAGSIESDRILLTQVLRNLLVNALKFTERGSVKLTCEDIDGYAVEFAVRDTGIGIAPVDQTRIFEEFYQVRGPLQARTKGTGLGLPYAKRVTEVLGGELFVESVPGHGSTFKLRLPRVWPVVGHRVEHVEERTSTTRVGSALIVDDDAGLRAVLRGMLQGVVTDVYEASGGIEALSIMRDMPPDIVFLDIRMPDVQGTDVVAEMKNDPALREIPVVIVSSQEASSAERLAASAFIEKSILNKDTVLKAIAKCRPEKYIP